MEAIWAITIIVSNLLITFLGLAWIHSENEKKLENSRKILEECQERLEKLAVNMRMDMKKLAEYVSFIKTRVKNKDIKNKN